MTDQIVTIQIGVLFPTNFPGDRAGTRVDIPAHEVLREDDNLTSMSDSTLITRVESYLDLAEGSMRDMVVQRPEEANVLITAKTRFGGFECEYCGATFKLYSDLTAHLRTNPGHDI